MILSTKTMGLSSIFKSELMVGIGVLLALILNFSERPMWFVGALSCKKKMEIVSGELFYQQAYHKFDAVVLTGMTVLLLSCFVLWWQFESVLPPPDNMFYAHHKWCGIAAHTTKFTDSCAHMNRA